MIADRNEFTINITRDEDEEKNSKNPQLQLFYIIKEIYTTEKSFRDNMKTLCEAFSYENIIGFDTKTQIQLIKLLAPFQHLANMELMNFGQLKEIAELNRGEISLNPHCLAFIMQEKNWEYLSEAAINYELFLELINSNELSENDRNLFKQISENLTSLRKGDGINSYIIQPVQRSPRYLLLLGQAEKIAESIELKEILKNFFNYAKKETDKLQLELATVKDTKKLLSVINKGRTKEIKKTLISIRKAIATTMQLDVNKKEDRKKTKNYTYEVYNIAMEQRQLDFDKKTKKLKILEKNIFSSLIFNIKTKKIKKIEKKIFSTLEEKVKEKIKSAINPVSPNDFLHSHERTLETHKELPQIGKNRNRKEIWGFKISK